MRRCYFNIWWCFLLFLCPFGLTANDFSLLSQGTLLLGGYGIFWGGASVRPLQLVVATTRALFWFRGLQVARGALLHKAMNAVGQQVLCTFPQYIMQRKKLYCNGEKEDRQWKRLTQCLDCPGSTSSPSWQRGELAPASDCREDLP